MFVYKNDTTFVLIISFLYLFLHANSIVHITSCHDLICLFLEQAQNPAEEPFDINSVPREVKSQPLVEKKAPGKKPTGLGAPPPPPTSAADAYERILSSIPEFASFGKLFKVCE